MTITVFVQKKQNKEEKAVGGEEDMQIKENI